MKKNKAPCVDFPSEKGRTVSVVAVAGGSSPVPEAEFLAARWEARAETIDKERQHLSATFAGITNTMIAKTKILRECAQELRRHAEAATVRQPDSNKSDQQRRHE